CLWFSSVSLDRPAVCVCPARTPPWGRPTRGAGRFCVNILAHDQEDVCRRLARSGTDKFAGIDWVPSPNGSPRLSGALASIDCELEREIDGGDHTVVIARVTALDEHSDAAPLLFYRSGFQRLEAP
uniref:flavin reductase family protein n=1 Tax=Nocardia wallacei TaxID=480035 RepID=UPI0024587292